MELKYCIALFVSAKIAATFNRTAYGIEIPQH